MEVTSKVLVRSSNGSGLFLASALYSSNVDYVDRSCYGNKIMYPLPVRTIEAVADTHATVFTDLEESNQLLNVCYIFVVDTLDDEKLLRTNTSMQTRDVLLALIRHLQNITRLHHASGGCVESTSTHFHSHRKVRRLSPTYRRAQAILLVCYTGISVKLPGTGILSCHIQPLTELRLAQDGGHRGQWHARCQLRSRTTILSSSITSFVHSTMCITMSFGHRVIYPSG